METINEKELLDKAARLGGSSVAFGIACSWGYVGELVR